MVLLGSTVSSRLPLCEPHARVSRAGVRTHPICSTGHTNVELSDSDSHCARTRTSFKPGCSTKCRVIYMEALDYCRAKEFDLARDAFARCTELCPGFSSAWVSWAQMEKRSTQDRLDNLERCRQVLQRGLRLNPEESRLYQSWGFMELQKGNLLAAVMLLERSVLYDPQRCAPVLRWQLVRRAQESVGPRRRARRLQNLRP